MKPGEVRGWKEEQKLCAEANGSAIRKVYTVELGALKAKCAHLTAVPGTNPRR